ncbi:MAG: hypothetical protein HUU46_18770 [Candidatus Hydrogenedentes bacterium]|nr:hypothetical protein [Candidatus Hydrogenedentota bacterium]
MRCNHVSVLLILAIASSARVAALDLSNAAVLNASSDPVVAAAADMLQDEVEARSGTRLKPVANLVPGQTTIVLCVREKQPAVPIDIPVVSLRAQADAYAIYANAGSSTVYVLGHDPRGVLFGVGKLIRLLDLGPGQISLSDTVNVTSAPAQRVRGHQMGYRETANTYDAWSVETYEQYIRDLIIFGTNSVELITSLDPKFVEGKVMARRQWDMNVDLTKLLKKYGMDVWFWMPLEGDVRDPQVAQKELDDRAKFFDAAAEITHIMVPGGDPGHTEPADLFPWLERMADVLHAKFPHANVWVSNQKFRFGPDVGDIFTDYLSKNQPKKIRGLVYGPRSPGTVIETRRRLPKQYLIRTYPDITHSLRCQFPVPNWHRLFSQTLDREPPNPRPVDEAIIFKATSEGSDGFVAYSDGNNDDLNKMLWSSLAWDPNASVDDVLHDYGCVFFGRDVAADVARALRLLEENWRGSPLENKGIEKTLELWKEIGARTDGRLAKNWRYQMYLCRAAFDAHVRERGIAEQQYEKEAYAALIRAASDGVETSINNARAALAKADSDTAGAKTRELMFALGPQMHESIGYQLSVDAPYFARNPERGAMLDKVDMPLNDRLWLEVQFKKILSEPDKTKQLAMIDTIVDWENPGPGGFYDDLGHIGREPHVVGWAPYEDDPGFVESPLDAFFRVMDNQTKEIAPLKYSWMDYVEAGGTTSLKMKYEKLDTKAAYKVRVTYHSRYNPELRLVADGKHEIHKPMQQPEPIWPVEFDIPAEATADGALELEWQLVSGRAVQVPEVWLIRK